MELPSSKMGKTAGAMEWEVILDLKAGRAEYKCPLDVSGRDVESGVWSILVEGYCGSNSPHTRDT